MALESVERYVVLRGVRECTDCDVQIRVHLLT